MSGVESVGFRVGESARAVLGSVSASVRGRCWVSPLGCVSALGASGGLLTRRPRYIIATCAVAGVISGSIFGIVSASGDADLAPGGLAPPGPARGEEWARNLQGQTYGSLMDARTPAEEPDLILVTSDAGELGYVKRELDGRLPRTPKEAAEYSPETRVIPVFESDGLTRIGWFTVGDGKNVIDREDS